MNNTTEQLQVVKELVNLVRLDPSVKEIRLEWTRINIGDEDCVWRILPVINIKRL